MLANSLLVAALLAMTSAVQATLYITEPVASSVYSAQDVFNVNWSVDPTKVMPLAKDFGAVHIGIYSGSTLQQFLVQDVGQVTDPTKVKNLRVQIDGSLGPNSDQYFVRIDSLKAKDPKTGAPLQSFSSRFTLSGMTGKFTAAQQKAVAGSNADVNATTTAAVGKATLATVVANSTRTTTARGGAAATPGVASNSSIAGIVSNATGITGATVGNASSAKGNTTTSATPKSGAEANVVRGAGLGAALAAAGLFALW